MSGTSVPNISFTANGFVAPLESAILAGYEADQSAAFGGNLNPAPNTPQGQIATTTTAIIGDGYDQQVALFNGVDPAYASGRLQDAIGRIYFLTRIPSAPTALQVTCTGLAGVVIPVGLPIGVDPSGNQYLTTAQGIIGSGGTVTMGFAASIPGPLAVPGTLAIYQAIPGLNTLAVISGIVGQNVETRAAFEARREASIASNAAGFLSAIQGAVLAVPGVLDAYTTENYTGSAVVTGGVSIAANSLYVCVAGGAQAAIAQAIWSKKNPGCAYTGNTTVTVYDTNSGYSSPYPSYSVTFEIPTAAPICLDVTLKNSAQVPNTAAVLVQNFVQQGFTGMDGGPRARIGSTLYASRYYADVAAIGSWVNIVSIQIGTDAIPTAVFTASIATTVLTVSAMIDATFTGTGSGVNLTVSAITGTIYPGYLLSGTGVPTGTTIISQTSGTIGGAGVYVTSGATTSSGASLTAVGVIAVGQFVFGTGVASGTIITALGTGTGGTGTYTVAISQTVGSEAMSSVAANQNDVAMRINWLPMLANADINVILV